jgi:hypothetical protein
MSDQFETIKTIETPRDQLRRVVAGAQALPKGLELDAEAGTMLESSGRRWAFVLTRQATKGWNRLGKEPVPLAVLVYDFSGLDRPFVQRVLVALPGDRDELRLEMRDDEWRVLWTGTGTLDGDELVFSMPITRPRVDAKGMMAGRIDAKGRLTLTEARLPKPSKPQTPTFDAEE